MRFPTAKSKIVVQRALQKKKNKNKQTNREPIEKKSDKTECLHNFAVFITENPLHLLLMLIRFSFPFSFGFFCVYRKYLDIEN